MLGILGIHLLALIAFGSWTVYQAVVPKDPTFEEPPPVEKIERVQLEYKVRMQQQQKKSQRPKQKLQVKQVSDIAMPDMDIAVPNINGSGGIGRFGEGGFGDLGDGGGLSLGEVSVDLFDIKAKGEKFLFVVDVRPDLLQDKKGGIPTYDVIKKDVIGLVNDLPSGVLFNMILFDRARMEIWRPNLVPATSTNKEAFAEWIAPVNSSLKEKGVRTRNFRPKAEEQPLGKRIRSDSWNAGNAQFMAMIAALEQQADAIYILSDSLPSLENIKERLAKDEKALEDQRENYLDRIKEATEFDSIEEYKKARKATSDEVSRRAREFKERENKARQKKGIPPRVYTRGENNQLRSRMEKVVAKDFKDYVPYVRGYNSNEYDPIPERELRDWIEMQQRLIYDQNNDERPQLNAIIFKGEDETVSESEEDNIDDFVDIFDGDYRVLIGLGKIDSGDVRN